MAPPPRAPGRAPYWMSGAVVHGTSSQVVLGCVTLKHPSFDAGVRDMALRHSLRSRRGTGEALAPGAAGADCAVSASPKSEGDPPEQPAASPPTATYITVINL